MNDQTTRGLPPGSLAAAMDTQQRLGAHKALEDMLAELDGMGGETMDPGPFRHGYREALGDVRTVIQRAMDRVLEGSRK